MELKWISVEERLPQDEERCWFYTPNDKVREGYFDPLGTYVSFEKKYVPGFRTNEYFMVGYLKDITHWMPYFTPEPPNELD